MSFNNGLVRRLKKELKVEKDLDLAEIFNVSPFMFSSWKRSKRRLIEEIVKYGVKNHLDFNKIFHSEAKEQLLEGETPVLMAEDLFEYCLSPAMKQDLAARYKLPIITGDTIGFQIISKNMEPRIPISSIVFGKDTKLDLLKYRDICVIHTASKGLFVNRYVERIEEECVFTNDNELFNDLRFREEEIISVFKVNGVFSVM